MNRSTSAKVVRSDEVRQLVASLGDWAFGAGPLFRQLARALAAAIESGRLPEGLRLPSERALAAALFLSRGTAVAAYDLLVADGLVERRHGSGTYVAGPAALGLPGGREGSALVHRLVEHSSTRSAVIDLSISVLHDASGLPPVTVSSADLSAMVPETGYSPWGAAGLRRLLADHVSDWGLPTNPGQLVITAGAQQAISAAAACWLRPGDTVVLEDPTYPGAIAAFTAAGARLVGVGPGQRDPEGEATGRGGEGPGREAVGQGGGQDPVAAGQFGGAAPPDIGRAGQEPLGQDLADGRGAQVGGGLDPGEAQGQGLGGPDEAQPEAAPEELGE